MTKKILYISGSIGLGHVFRDLAVARELRKLRPEIDLYWLAEPPVTQVLAEAGEKVLPDAYAFNNELVNKLSGSENQFNVMQFFHLSKDSTMKTFEEDMKIIKRENFDFVIADEAYELSTGYIQYPEKFEKPGIMMWDFVKWYSMTNSPMDRIAAWVINRFYDKGYKMKQRPEFLSIFFGELEDIPDERLGLFLINARDWGREFCTFVGYPIHFNPKQYNNPAEIKERLGYGKEPLILCAIGGTRVGVGLLDLCARAYPLIKKEVPNVRMVLVGGPAVQPGSLELPNGVVMHGYLPKLYEHFAACDLAIVLGGGSTTLELTVLKRPFIYFPLEKHSEQMLSVSHVLEKHRAGVKMLFSKTTPEMLAKEAISNIGKKVEYLDMPIDGCKKAAEVIAKSI
ncbi:MAG: hypothetical protein LUQ20_00080 [Candidatus Methanoperedens sp.]|nr:hypothetical protein [Candidatus Methanoperedens sp.]